MDNAVNGLSELRTTLLWLSALALCCAGVFLSPTYVAAFASFATLCLLAVCAVPVPFRPLIAFGAIAWLAGLANISSWRGYITPETLELYAASVLALVTPMVLMTRGHRLARGQLRLTAAGYVAVAINLALPLVAVAYLYATLGPIVVRQDLRFLIPPALEYTVRASLPLAILAPVLFTVGYQRFCVVAVAALPTLLIGSRGSVVIALVGFVIASQLLAPATSELPRRGRLKLALVLAASVAVVFGGFYARRAAGSQLAAVEVVKNAYFDYDGWWVYAVMPLHLGFREPAGLANRIVSEELRNDIAATPLIVADLTTVLPGEQLAAGQALGQIAGAVEAGGLTPGLLGGLYLDYGPYAVTGFLTAGMLLAVLATAGGHSLRAAALFLVVELQVLHLLHRGFLKPEYFTVCVITAVYLILSVPRKELRSE